MNGKECRGMVDGDIQFLEKDKITRPSDNYLVYKDISIALRKYSGNVSTIYI